MTKEELKIAIRESFPDNSIKNAFSRLGFILIEVSHAYINIIKESIAKGIGEDLADELKYVIGYLIPALILAWILL